ncbi:hypothetical protein BDP27DRAFT_1447842 [Rhodocollybia butyracea]|uniref:Uncharacterized protein n=1 Tax=Rhodocollybia butyracea TaxID=206335 RepID=A0A9P5PNN3_9AGAR|nr:hypothetical protein BDP27DRAFT_1447842 [Rhodocollybia butyracea]
MSATEVAEAMDNIPTVINEPEHQIHNTAFLDSNISLKTMEDEADVIFALNGVAKGGGDSSHDASHIIAQEPEHLFVGKEENGILHNENDTDLVNGISQRDDILEETKSIQALAGENEEPSSNASTTQEDDSATTETSAAEDVEQARAELALDASNDQVSNTQVEDGVTDDTEGLKQPLEVLIEQVHSEELNRQVDSHSSEDSGLMVDESSVTEANAELEETTNAETESALPADIPSVQEVEDSVIEIAARAADPASTPVQQENDAVEEDLAINNSGDIPAPSQELMESVQQLENEEVAADPVVNVANESLVDTETKQVEPEASETPAPEPIVEAESATDEVAEDFQAETIIDEPVGEANQIETEVAESPAPDSEPIVERTPPEISEEVSQAEEESVKPEVYESPALESVADKVAETTIEESTDREASEPTIESAVDEVVDGPQVESVVEEPRVETSEVQPEVFDRAPEPAVVDTGEQAESTQVENMIEEEPAVETRKVQPEVPDPSAILDATDKVAEGTQLENVIEEELAGETSKVQPEIPDPTPEAVVVEDVDMAEGAQVQSIVEEESANLEIPQPEKTTEENPVAETSVVQDEDHDTAPESVVVNDDDEVAEGTQAETTVDKPHLKAPEPEVTIGEDPVIETSKGQAGVHDSISESVVDVDDEVAEGTQVETVVDEDSAQLKAPEPEVAIDEDPIVETSKVQGEVHDPAPESVVDAVDEVMEATQAEAIVEEPATETSSVEPGESENAAPEPEYTADEVAETQQLDEVISEPNPESRVESAADEVVETLHSETEGSTTPDKAPDLVVDEAGESNEEPEVLAPEHVVENVADGVADSHLVEAIVEQPFVETSQVESDAFEISAPEPDHAMVEAVVSDSAPEPTVESAGDEERAAVETLLEESSNPVEEEIPVQETVPEPEVEAVLTTESTLDNAPTEISTYPAVERSEEGAEEPYAEESSLVNDAVGATEIPESQTTDLASESEQASFTPLDEPSSELVEDETSSERDLPENNASVVVSEAPVPTTAAGVVADEGVESREESQIVENPEVDIPLVGLQAAPESGNSFAEEMPADETVNANTVENDVVLPEDSESHVRSELLREPSPGPKDDAVSLPEIPVVDAPILPPANVSFTTVDHSSPRETTEEVLAISDIPANHLPPAPASIVHSGETPGPQLALSSSEIVTAALAAEDAEDDVETSAHYRPEASERTPDVVDQLEEVNIDVEQDEVQVKDEAEVEGSSSDEVNTEQQQQLVVEANVLDEPHVFQEAAITIGEEATDLYSLNAVEKVGDELEPTEPAVEALAADGQDNVSPESLEAGLSSIEAEGTLVVNSDDIESKVNEVDAVQPLEVAEVEAMERSTANAEITVDSDIEPTPETASAEVAVAEPPSHDVEDVASAQSLGEIDTSNLSVNTPEIERPKSPWTPSYSVTSQGPGIDKEEDIPEIEQLPSTITTGAETQIPAVQVTDEEVDVPAANVEAKSVPSRPSSPWVSSYSVSIQGSPSVSAHASPVLVATDLPKEKEIIDQSFDSQVESVPTDYGSARLESIINGSAEFTESQKFEEESAPEFSVSGEAPADSTESAVATDFDAIAAPVLALEDSVPNVDSIFSNSDSKDESVEEPRELLSANLNSDNLASAPTESSMFSPVPELTLPAQPEFDIEPSAEILSVEKDQFVEEPDNKQDNGTPVVSSDVTDESVPVSTALSPSEAVGMERPKSPWGSYEVTNQSGSKTPLEEPAVVEDVEELASFIADIPAAESVQEPVPEEVEPTEAEPKEAEPKEDRVSADKSKLTVDTTQSDAPERPKSPWTPSYSVSRQGSRVFNETKDESELEKIEQLPPPSAQSPTAVSQDGEAPSTSAGQELVASSKEPTSSSEAFPTIEEAENTDQVGDTLTVTKERKRLESTASSLFFPGGWFSRPPAGRASLDNAQGEIISPKALSPTEGPLSSIAPVPSVSEPAAVEGAEVAEGSKEKKEKWCVVM